MRILAVVQRYGGQVAAGAEGACRAFATRLAARGHTVEVVTSAALDYSTWAEALPVGTEADGEVTVHRLATERGRDAAFFPALSSRVLLGDHALPWYLQRRWVQAQGPVLAGLGDWVGDHASRFDVVVAFTYLYAPTIDAVAAAAATPTPVVLQPFAHDEPPIHLPIYRAMVHQVDAFAFSTPEEEALVRRLFGATTPGAQIGIGVDLPDAPADPGLARQALPALGDAPYLCCVGRMEHTKGTHALAAAFATYKRRNPGPLRLVFVGDPVQPPPPHPDVVVAGLQPEAVKASVMAGAQLCVNPSFFESFSLVLCESWGQGTPVLVDGRTDVLAGQVRRSAGGLAYTTYAEFEEALRWRAEEPATFAAMAARGLAYVRAAYTWGPVLDRYEALLHATAERRR